MIPVSYTHLISVDTFKSSVAESAIQAGADLVNDIWGLKYDSEMGAVIAKYDVACCLMHNKSNTEYNNFLIDMLSETQECVNLARKAGIKDEKIILDPGVGFGKTFEMNLETMNHLELFKNLGFPVLLGTSRKSMIGLALDLPVDQRVEGTLATDVYKRQSSSFVFCKTELTWTALSAMPEKSASSEKTFSSPILLRISLNSAVVSKFSLGILQLTSSYSGSDSRLSLIHILERILFTAFLSIILKSEAFCIFTPVALDMIP